MFIFKKERDKSNQFDTTNVVIESVAVSLPEILSDFKEFLLACGYQIRPEEEIVIHNTEE